MKIQYFKSTDTLYIEFSRGAIVETRDLDEDTVIDLDASGRGKGTLYRQVLNLPLAASACPTTAPSTGAALMATKVSACKFDYGGTDLQRNALVSMTLSVTDSGETVGLHHEVHVSNEP